MKIVAFSDTHTYHRQVAVPDGDVLVFAGDLMGSGYKHTEVKDFAEWFGGLPHRNKIVVAGNHDRLFETNPTWALQQFSRPSIGSFVYLRDSSVTIEGVKFYGSPVQPWFLDWAFNVPRGAAIREYWDRIPHDTDVLITHGPPYGVLDQMVPTGEMLYKTNRILLPTEHLGCEELAKVVEIVKPKVHIFGHIHGGAGTTIKDGVAFHNVAVCNESYRPVNDPHVIEIDEDAVFNEAWDRVSDRKAD